MLMGLIAPTSGSASVAGVAIPNEPAQLATLRARVGLLTETPGFYDRLTAIENLTLFGRMYGLTPDRLVSRVEPLLTRLGIWDRRDELVATYSKGMKQKLAVVRTVFHDPQVMFFDEPTAGLDPESARIVREMIMSLKREGRTMIVCTHNLAEATELADLVAIIRSRLLAFGPTSELGNGEGAKTSRFTLGGDAAAARAIVASLPGTQSVTAQGPQLDVTLDDPRLRNPAIVAALVQAGFAVIEARVVERSLEEFYLDAVGADTR
jgi:ABC-2 type transport system ATP-binding protein